MTKTTVFVALWLLFLQSGIAGATVYPDECDEGVYAIDYQTGLATGKSLVSQAWNGLEQRCTKVDLLDEVVSDSIDSFIPILGGASDNVARRFNCRFGGHVDGMLQRVSEIMDDCSVICCNQGATMGEHYAHAYCLIAVAANGVYDPGDYVRPDVIFCGGYFESCCDEASYDYASSWSECVPFVTLSNSVAFEHYIDFTCAF
jgi:hypothetical protein